MRRLRLAAAAVALFAAGGGAAARPPVEGISARGLLRPEAEIALHARSGGLVLSVPHWEGDAVAAGEPVVLLDDAEARSKVALARCNLEDAELRLKLSSTARPEELERAKAQYEEAKAGEQLALKTLEADRKLHLDGLVSDLGRQRSERSLEKSRAEVESRRLDLKILQQGRRPEEIRQAEIEVERRRAEVAEAERLAALTRVSPTRKGRAVVSRVFVEPGQWIDENRVVAEVVYMDRVRVELDLPSEDGLRVLRGAKATVRSPLYPGVSLDATVERVAPVIDPGSGTVRVVVSAENPELRMRPGVAAEVEIVP